MRTPSAGQAVDVLSPRCQADVHPIHHQRPPAAAAAAAAAASVVAVVAVAPVSSA